MEWTKEVEAGVRRNIAAAKENATQLGIEPTRVVISYEAATAAVAEIERLTTKLAGIQGVAAESDGMMMTISEQAAQVARLSALFAKWAPLLAPYLNGEQLADLRGDVVRAVDASRPGLTEEEAQAWADDLLERTNAGPGRRALVGDALLLASRGETGPTPAALPEAQATDVRSVRRRLGLTQEALGEKIGYRGETISRWENGHEEAPAVVRLALIGLAASGGLAPRGMPSRAAQLPNEGPDATPGHVLIPRAILERLAKAAASDPDAREARWSAERILQRATLAAEPARTDPEAARARRSAVVVPSGAARPRSWDEPIPDSISPRGSSYDGAHAPARVLCPTCERWHFPTDCCQA